VVYELLSTSGVRKSHDQHRTIKKIKLNGNDHGYFSNENLALHSVVGLRVEGLDLGCRVEDLEFGVEGLGSGFGV